MSDDVTLAILMIVMVLYVSVIIWLTCRPKKEVDPFEWPEVPRGECNCYGILPRMTPITKCAECGREIK